MSESPDIIKIHDLRPARGAKTRVARGEGGKGGKTAGRGPKGTGARKNVPAGFEGGQMPLHMRLPKLKGFRNRFRTEYQVVNVGDLARLFPEGGEIGPAELVEAGAVRRNQLVKVLGEGELDGVALTVTAHRFSGSARDKIAAAGGTANQLCGRSGWAGAGRRCPRNGRRRGGGPRRGRAGRSGARRRRRRASPR